LASAVRVILVFGKIFCFACVVQRPSSAEPYYSELAASLRGQEPSPSRFLSLDDTLEAVPRSDSGVVSPFAYPASGDVDLPLVRVCLDFVLLFLIDQLSGRSRPTFV